MEATKSQKKAMNDEGSSIIVSAGAGSGKTEVLKERAKRKVKEKTHVHNLLILTFTNAAAQEMKDRIRDAIISTPGLEEEINNIDCAYITTFDAYSLALVKKYHTRLNISNKIEITDEGVIDLKKQELLEEILEEYYENPTPKFLKLIDHFCLKDDDTLKESILKCYKKIELKVDKTNFLKNYFKIFNDEKIRFFKEKYMNFLRERQETVQELFNSCTNYFDSDYLQKLGSAIRPFIEAKTYEEIKEASNLPRADARKGEEEGKRIKGDIYNLVKDLREKVLIYETEEELIEDINSTKDDVEVLVEILKKLDERLEDYKRKRDSYSFNDIARMVIKVLEENEDIREELKSKYKEIMIDEYQDTSDTQERFISLISNNNVYMVGDIKQSIYRFRNANPYIFKKKYDLYRDTNQGEKIDLLENFRSRKEVLEDINLLFKYIMDDKIGGADYIKDHQMIPGNLSYDTTYKTKQNNHMEIYSYNKEDLGNISEEEEEAFIIGMDIKERINNKFQVVDKKKKVLRDCTYKDFVILLEKTKDFELYKKVFEYLHIPLSVLKEESLRKEDDVYIFKNLLKWILLIKKNEKEEEFKYLYTSLSRSFIYKTKDEEIYDHIINNTIEDTIIYQDCLSLSEKLDTMNPSKFFLEVLKTIDYDNKILTNHNIESFQIRAEYFYNLIKQMEEKGMDLENFIEYLDKVFDNDDDIKFNTITDSMNASQIMTIHKSKGLEFPICYFAGFTSGFNFMELNERILFDNDYGIVLPKVTNCFKNTILKQLLKRKVKLDEVGEKIRLFYVATTRASEKMILVLPKEEETNYITNIIPCYIREKYSSIESIIKSIYSLVLPYIVEKDIIATKDYLKLFEKQSLEKIDKKINVKELNCTPKVIEEKHFSKAQTHIPTKEEKEVMNIGTQVHELLEEIDFTNKEELELIEDPIIKEKIKNFLNTDIMKKYIHNPMYKEYEFMEENNNTLNHGIIDLLIEDNNKYIIIDYKLKNIEDPNYDKQLNGYKNYIEKKTSKECICYLYSIMDNIYREINYENQ